MSAILATAQIEAKINGLVNQAKALVDMTEVKHENAEDSYRKLITQWSKVLSKVNDYFQSKSAKHQRVLEDIAVELDHVTVFRNNLVARFGAVDPL